MMYVLTQEELDALNKAAAARTVANVNKLQEVCTLAALHVPIKRDWEPGAAPRPWGCILVDKHDPGYCDECPVTEACPCDRKRWSK